MSRSKFRQEVTKFENLQWNYSPGIVSYKGNYDELKTEMEKSAKVGLSNCAVKFNTNKEMLQIVCKLVLDGFEVKMYFKAESGRAAQIRVGW